MCGIAGFVDPRRRLGDRPLSQVAEAMAATLRHRGPDDGHTWSDAAARVAFGHRRLSVVDLSPAGRQPMTSASGRFTIAYNGEIYSHREIRRDLESAGVQFRGHSDTEVILEAFDRWSIPSTLERMIGMFAIALWDSRDRELHLLRDRLGIKPLYWGNPDGGLIFASELKALRAHPGWEPSLNRDAIAAYMRHNYIPAPHSVYRGIHKLEPGCHLRFDANGNVTVRRYWDFSAVAKSRHGKRSDVSIAEAGESLETLLLDAVGRRMIADVPLGALLSGGIDSTLVTALMQAQSSRPVRTFSIGFREAGFDEAPHARAIAEHLGTDHTELYVDPAQALDVIPRLPDYYDEPFADSSQIPTFLVCELCRRHVTVALSGDGGDELFAGYNRYLFGNRMWRRLSRVPLPLRQLTGAMARGLPESLLDSCARVLPRGRRPAQFGLKVHKAARALLHGTPDSLYRQLLTHWDEPERLVLGASEPRGVLWNDALKDELPDFTERMMYLDTLTYLPDDILTKVDRASMAVSLEARVPLLDHRVVEMAWSLPLAFKTAGAESKILLRRVLERYVPKRLTDRPKMGFGIPIDAWLRGPLRDWAGSLLDEHRLQQQGLLDPGPVLAAWHAHQQGANHAYALWDVLVLEAWLDRYQIDDASGAQEMTVPPAAG